MLIFANIIDAATVDPNKPRSEISYEAREQGLTYLKAGASDVCGGGVERELPR